jgi:hypothetical protein
MKELVNQWVTQRARLRGVLACGVRFADKTSFTKSWTPDFPAPALDNAWRCASDAFQVLKINLFPNDHIRWVYENAFLYCARRDDGTCLGIFTAKDPKAFDAAGIERLLAEFRALEAG